MLVATHNTPLTFFGPVGTPMSVAHRNPTALPGPVGTQCQWPPHPSIVIFDGSWRVYVPWTSQEVFVSPVSGRELVALLHFTSFVSLLAKWATKTFSHIHDPGMRINLAGDRNVHHLPVASRRILDDLEWHTNRSTINETTSGSEPDEQEILPERNTKSPTIGR